jgi:hypothetical protein
MTAQKTEAVTGSVHRLHGSRGGAGDAQALAEGMEAMVATAAAWQREAMDFVASRLAKDSETMRKLGTCKDPTESLAIYSRWVQETMQDYSAEATRLVETCTRYTDWAAPRRR